MKGLDAPAMDNNRTNTYGSKGSPNEPQISAGPVLAIILPSMLGVILIILVVASVLQ